MDKYKILAVSYCYPPMALPQAIQIPRFLKCLDYSMVVLCGDDPYVKIDETVLNEEIKGVQSILRVPYKYPRLLGYVDYIANYMNFSIASFPDVQRGWVNKAYKFLKKWEMKNKFTPDMIITFGQPMSDHIFGLKYKKYLGIPWIAHFSDPWVDNSYRNDTFLSKAINMHLEAQVIKEADAVIFTSPETKELVMEKYQKEWVRKAFNIPHIIDKTIYDKGISPSADIYIIRYLGSFYGHRSPKPLFDAIEEIAERTPELLERVIIEIVGSLGKYHGLLKKYKLLEKHVRFVGNVSYEDSIHLMQTAHCLLVIDAPDKLAVFFPSKLVDYIGSGRFIAAISPANGTTARIVGELGGYTADPSDGNGVMSIISTILEERPERLISYTNKYEMETVRNNINKIINSLKD